MSEEKIPVQQVLDDMYNPDCGPISWAARDYYYINYATPEEQYELDREDKVQTILAVIFMIVLIGGPIVAGILGFIYGLR